MSVQHKYDNVCNANVSHMITTKK